MELHQLKTFIQVVQGASFSRAALALHLTQPAVSQQIGVLESELGVSLLHRAGRSVRPTPAGEILLDYARTLVSLAERGQAALAEFRAEGRGRLILGAGNTTITFRLPPLLREYRRRESAVEVVVRAGISKDLLALLEQGQLDVALVTSPAKGSHLQSAPLFTDEIVLILPKEHPVSALSAPSPSDLQGVPSILYARGSGFRQFLDEAFTRAGYRPEILMELDSIEGIKQLVQIGLGLSFLPRIAVEKELSAGDLISRPVAGLTPLTRTTHVIYRQEQFLPAPLLAFLDLLAERYAGNFSLPAHHKTKRSRNGKTAAGKPKS